MKKFWFSESLEKFLLNRHQRDFVIFKFLKIRYREFCSKLHFFGFHTFTGIVSWSYPSPLRTWMKRLKGKKFTVPCYPWHKLKSSSCRMAVKGSRGAQEMKAIVPNLWWRRSTDSKLPGDRLAFALFTKFLALVMKMGTQLLHGSLVQSEKWCCPEPWGKETISRVPRTSWAKMKWW